jgi:autotransporter-associated beta strand protein
LKLRIQPKNTKSVKIRKNPFLQSALAAAMALGVSPSLQAAALTWTGGAGTWQIGNTGQWGVAWADGDTATFNNVSGGAVTLGGAVATGNAALAFSAGNFSFSAGAPLAITLGNNNITLGSGVTTTLGTNVTVNRSGGWLLDGNSDETSTLNLTAGKLDGTSANASTIRETTVNVNSGGVLENGTSIVVGDTADGATVNVAGGTVNVESTNSNFVLNNGAVAAPVTVTISSGAITFTNSGATTGGIRFGRSDATNPGVFNLDGGIVTANKVYRVSSVAANCTFNFNGGTLRALRDNTTDFMTGITAAVVKSGGAIIDTNGKSITMAQVLTPGSPSGGLTKNGLGTLTLTGDSTYTGPTNVAAGRLNVGTDGSLVSNISVSASGTLGGEGLASGSTSFATSGSTFAFDPATPGAFTATSLSLGSSIVQLSSDSAMTPTTTYLVMTNSAGFSGSPLDHFRSPGRGSLAYTGVGNVNLEFTFAGSDSVKWKGGDITNPSFWDSESTANWDNDGATDKFFPGDDVLFDDTASSFTVAIQGTAVKPNSLTFNNTTTYTLSGGAIDGATGLVKNGTGALVLGSANSYLGTTAINDGELRVSGGSAIRDAGLVTLADVAGAGFRVLGSETVGTITGGGATGGNITIDGAQTLTLSSGTGTHSGTVSGGGALAVAGANQTFDGAVSISGGLTVSGGRVTLNGNNSYTGATSVAVNSGILSSHANGLGAVGSGNETTILGSGSAASGQIGLSGGITTPAEKVVGSGLGHVTPATVDGFTAQQRGIVQSVSGDNTFAGDIEINSTGITRIGTQNGALLTLGGNITRSIGVTGIQVLFRAGDTSGDFVTLTSAGHDFDECLIYSGGAAGAAGLRLGVDNAVPTSTTVMGATSSVAATAFDLNGFDQTLNGLKVQAGGDGAFKIVNLDMVEPSTLTLANTLNRSSSLASISNNGGTGGVINVVKTGAFTQGLGATNTYTGTTSIQGGRLDFLKQVSLYNNTPASWTPAKITVESGATLGLNVGGTGEFTGPDVETLIANMASSNGDGLKAGSLLGLNVTADTTVTTALANTGGTTGGAIGLVKTGAAKLTMTTANTYSGDTTVSAGTLQLDAANGSNEGSTVTIASTGAFLELNFGGTDTVDKLFIDGVQQAAGVYEAVGNPGSDTEIAQITGTGTLTVNSGPTGYLGWAAANAPGQTAEQDHDDDGTLNGIEYFMGETGTTFTANPAPVGGAVVWPMGATYSGTHGVDFVIETSGDLLAWAPGTIGVGPGTVQINAGVSATYTLPTAAGPHFVRLRVIAE